MTPTPNLNVLSLFDGISCSQLALDHANINYTIYASEIDKYAIKITQQNYPNTIQLGDIRNINVNELPKIDIILNSFPCTNLSLIANVSSRTGLKGEASSLFYDSLTIMKSVKERNPNVKIILENVASMKKTEFKKIDSELKRIFPDITHHFLNSSILSASNRRRYYWSNIEIPLNISLTAKEMQLQKQTFQDVLKNGYTNLNKGNVILSSIPTLLTSGFNRYLNRGIGNIVFQDKLFSELSKEEMLLEYPKLLKASGYVGKRRAKNDTDEYSFRNGVFRNLSINEIEACLALPENYVDSCNLSNSRKVKLLGQVYTPSVVGKLLSFLKDDENFEKYFFIE